MSYYTPFINISKTGVLQRGFYAMTELNLNPTIVLSNTHTCYAPNERGESCGKCGSCVERLEAFANLHSTDPLKYIK